MIDVRNVHKELGEFSLRGVDLRVETGEYFVVLGPTGAGKTVLLECIAGLWKLDRGEVWLEGRNVTDLEPELRNVSYVPQDYVLFPHMSLRDNIEFSLVVRGAPRELRQRRVRELSELLGIAHLLERRPLTLSGGEQQRGALARALAPSPTVLLLDEPLSALDEGTRRELTPELGKVSGELKTTVIHVCHNFDEALELADRIAIIHQGRVAQVGTPAEVFRAPLGEFVARFVGSENLLPVRSCDRASCAVVLDGGIPLRVRHIPTADGLLAIIHPDEISLCADDGDAAPCAPNAVPCLLARADDRGRFVRLRLEGPVCLTALMTRQAFAASKVAEGDRVLAHFRPEAVHLLTP